MYEMQRRVESQRLLPGLEPRRMIILKLEETVQDEQVWEGHLELADCKFSSVQWLSRVQLFETPWTAARQASLSIINS